MEVMAFCIRLIIDVQVVLTAIAQHSYCSEKEDAAFPHIVPKRLQFFEYESIHLSCKTDISTDITVLRTVKEIDISRNAPNWMTSRGSGTVNPAFAADSGAYWCEDKEGHKSNTINISVTAGMVILESPVPPTNKGENVTLYCKKKNTTGLVAEFYKNGLLFKTGYKGFITIKNVSTSDEGLYKCHISGVGESSESWLTVMEPYESGHQPLNHHSNPQTLLWRVITFSLVSLLLLALGVIYYRKHTSADIQTEVTTSRGHNCSLDPQIATYAVVNTQEKKKVTGSIAEPQNVICTKVKKQRKEEDLIYEVVKIKENKEQDSNLHARPSLQEETVAYSSIKYVADY